MGKNIPTELSREDTRVKATKKLLTGKTVSFLKKIFFHLSPSIYSIMITLRQDFLTGYQTLYVIF